MKKQLITTFVLLALCPAFSRAETIVQAFHAMFTAVPQQLQTVSPYTVGTTDFVTYTCSGTGTQFGMYNSLISVCLKNSTGAMVTSPAINDLDSIYFMYDPLNTSTYTNEYKEIKVYISENNEDWTEVSVRQVNKGASSVKFPSTGNYFVKFRNPTSSPVYLLGIHYITNPTPVSSCNCLRVVSE